jgi:hypothetical protein
MLFLMIILMVLISIYIFLYLPDNIKKDNWGKEYLFSNIQKSNIHSISISYNDETNISQTKMENISNKWKIIEPIMDIADDESILKIINNIPGLKSLNILTNLAKEQIDGLGFKKPKLIIQIGFSNNESIMFLVGDKTPTEDQFYAVLNENYTKIYLLDENQLSFLYKSTGDLRNKEIFSIPVNELNSFEINIGKITNYIFNTVSTNNIEEFKLISPVLMKTDAYTVKSKLIDIYTIMILKYLDDNSQDYLSYGLNKPRYLIKLLSKDGKVNELHIGNTNSAGYYYSYSPQKKGFFLIDDSELTNKLSLDIAMFVKKNTNG